MDATSVKYIDPLVKGKAKQGTVWGYNGDATRPYILYDFQTNGKRDGPEAFLRDYHSYLQCDAHSIYDQIFAPVDAAHTGAIAGTVEIVKQMCAEAVVTGEIMPAVPIAGTAICKKFLRFMLIFG